MPNFRELMTMPADAGDFVRALKQDEFRREYDRHMHLYSVKLRDPALTAFERGDHAPAPAVLERAARLSGWTAHSGDACPVPYGTMVEIRTRGGLVERAVVQAFLWYTDGTPCDSDIVEWRLATQEAAEAPKVGGWVRHECTEDSVCPVPGDTLVRVAFGWGTERAIRRADFWLWRLPSSIIAYSTDAVCPPWPEAK